MPHNTFSWRSCCCCWRLQQQLLLILLVHQQFLCHAVWATRTATTLPAAATPTPLATPLPLVSSSEATLLTSGPFAASPQMYQQRHDGAETDDAAAASENEIGTSRAAQSSAEAPDPTEAEETETAANAHGSDALQKNRYKIVSARTNCTRDFFELQLELNHGFRGLLYAKDFPLECRARGSSHSNITLRLPTSGCGVRAEPRAQGMEFSVRVMLQTELKLRQSSDILRTMRCKVPLNAMGMSVMASPMASMLQENQQMEMKESYRNGRMRTLDDSQLNRKNIGNAATADSTNEAQTQQSQQLQQQSTTTTTSTPRVRIWLELGGPDGSGAVEVGQATTLTVRAIVPGKMGVRVVDCAALDGLGESTQQLLDERGCPIDEQVMPALHTRFQPAEEGWSKQNDDDLVEKTFTATFPAFKFPDRERLHVSCGVQLCKGNCPNINCRSAEPFLLSTDTNLARIEVFNSLAVTAPQIEVDRLRYDRRYNMTVEEYPPYVRAIPSDGTLCLSVSKLAISFCVLGLIFLIAIIVAIFSLIRSRRRAAGVQHVGALTSAANGNRLHRAEVCTSMFSSSSESAQSARFGSKLFMPYYPNTLPYGRVY